MIRFSGLLDASFELRVELFGLFFPDLLLVRDPFTFGIEDHGFAIFDLGFTFLVGFLGNIGFTFLLALLGVLVGKAVFSSEFVSSFLDLVLIERIWAVASTMILLITVPTSKFDLSTVDCN